MFDEILFSVVIPVYNTASYLEECLKSIISQIQDDKDIEILLVDDGSTDNSGEICDYYSQKYPNFIRVFHKENQGLLLARRFGYQNAKGLYIINCDSDDTLELNALNNLKRIVNTTHADVIIFNINMWDGINKEIFYNNVFTNKELSRIDKEKVYQNYLSSHESISMCGKIFKKKCLDFNLDYSFFEKKSFGEDTLQSAELYTNANDIVYYNKQLYNYRKDSGMTKKYNPYYYKDFKDINIFLRKYKYIWNLDKFDELFSIKLFTVIARTITQSRYKKNMTYKQRKEILISIYNDDDFKEYCKYYHKIKKQLKPSYKLIDSLFIRKYFLLIDVFLKIKNIISDK